VVTWQVWRAGVVNSALTSKLISARAGSRDGERADSPTGPVTPVCRRPIWAHPAPS